jgi:hypothetical protein
MEWHRVVHHLVILFAALAAASQALAADMCARGTDPVACVLIEQRDNALADAAVSEGARRQEVAARTADQAYWKAYIAGVPDLVELRSQLRALCEWHGQQIAPAAKICAWSEKWRQ